MRSRNSKFKIQNPKQTPAGGAWGFRISDFGFQIGQLLVAASLAHAAAPGEGGDNDLVLSPPQGLMPPTFWERFGWPLSVACLLCLVGAGVLLWLLTRPRPPVVVPPAWEARRVLQLLLRRPEDGAVLSQISQALRHYVAAAFDLPAGEFTTAEFNRLLECHEGIGAELSRSLREFLRECDERKFAPVAAPPVIGSVARALHLLETAEARRTLVCLAAPPPASQPASRT
jgi:hypothetical protein